MEAKIKPGYDTDRTRLADVIPLDVPFTLDLSPSSACNFKCFYCVHSKSSAERENLGYKDQNMSWDMFMKIVDQLSAFPKPLKHIQFVGLGEPLLNPKTPEMVKVLMERGIVEKQLDVFTNGYLLNEDVAHRLIDAGLTRLRISLQGLDAESYKKNCGVDLDFQAFLKQIKYFYDNRGDTKLYLKIIDAMLAPGEEKIFYDMFGNICDEIFIEHLGSLQIDMQDELTSIDESFSLYRETIKTKDVCPFAFYSFQINALGDLYPCTPAGLPPSFLMGNIQNTTIAEFWQGKRRKSFLMKMLRDGRYSIPVCKDCTCWSAINSDSDFLDNDRKLLLRRLTGEDNRV
ncbi:radical SAM protein [Synergistales bacterium]|nr:radical SAM protein [Synergistales bacterium]